MIIELIFMEENRIKEKKCKKIAYTKKFLEIKNK
jgi:hypothetical protein